MERHIIILLQTPHEPTLRVFTSVEVDEWLSLGRSGSSGKSSKKIKQVSV